MRHFALMVVAMVVTIIVTMRLQLGRAGFDLDFFFEGAASH
jgi:hypothetical protein